MRAGARETLFYISVVGFLSTRMIQTIDGLKISNPFWIAVLTFFVLGVYFGSNFWILSKCTVPRGNEAEDDDANDERLTL